MKMFKLNKKKYMKFVKPTSKIRYSLANPMYKHYKTCVGKLV